MKKISPITYLKSARNAEHYHLQKSFLTAITSDFATKYSVSGFRDNYSGLFQKEDEAYLQSQAFADTQVIDEKDVVRDQRYKLVDLTVQSGLYSLTPAEVEAAKKLAFAMKPYTGASSKPHAENTAMVDDMVQKLQSADYTSAVQALKLADAITALKTANDDFEQSFSRRADEKLLRNNADNLKAIRPQVDSAFGQLAEAISALYLVNELIEHNATKAAEIGTVIDAVNAQIVQFSETLSRRGAGSKAKIDNDKPNVNPPGGGGSGEKPDDL